MKRKTKKLPVILLCAVAYSFTFGVAQAKAHEGDEFDPATGVHIIAKNYVDEMPTNLSVTDINETALEEKVNAEAVKEELNTEDATIIAWFKKHVIAKIKELLGL